MPYDIDGRIDSHRPLARARKQPEAQGKHDDQQQREPEGRDRDAHVAEPAYDIVYPSVLVCSCCQAERYRQDDGQHERSGHKPYRPGQALKNLRADRQEIIQRDSPVAGERLSCPSHILVHDITGKAQVFPQQIQLLF